MIAGIIALNAGDTIGLTLSCLQQSHLIERVIVVHGAVEKYAKVNPEMVTKNCLSVDNTREIIKQYSKVKLIEKNKPFKNKSDLQNEIFRELQRYKADEDKLFLRIDADEYIFPTDLDDIFSYFIKHEPDCLNLKLIHYWKRLDKAVIGGQWDTPALRLFRFNPYIRYSQSKFIIDSFTVLFDMRKMKYLNAKIDNNMIFPRKVLHHIGYAICNGDMIRAKLNYYRNRGIEKSVIDTWSNWKEGDKVSPTHDIENESIINVKEFKPI